MLRSSDLLSLRVKDVMNESGSVKTEVRVKQKKTGKTTLNIPLSKNSLDVIKKHLVDKEQEDFIFMGQMGHFMREPICSQKYARIVKGWMRKLVVEDVSEYSTHSMRKTKPSVIFDKTHNINAIRKLLGKSSVTATS